MSGPVARRIPVDVPAEDATGVQSTVPQNCGAAFWLVGDVDASVQVEVTPDGTNWIAVGSALTAFGYVELPQCVAVRVVVSSYNAETPEGFVLYSLAG